MNRSPDTGTGRAADPIKRLRRLAWLLDSIRLPGGFGIGLDGL